MQGRIGRIGVLATLAAIAFASQASAATYTNASAITFTNGPANNGSVYPSTIDVAGLNGPLADINVTLSDVSHTFPDDLGVVLVGPGGRALLLQDGAGEDPDLAGATYTFDDQATAELPDATAWGFGSYRPTGHYPDSSFPAPGPGTAYAHPGPVGLGNSATLNGTYANTNPNGSWRLFARDFSDADGGSIAGGWSLEIRVRPDSTAPNTTIESGPGAITNSADASLSFSANEASTFQCRVDAGPFVACTSPTAFPGLAEGAHTIQVRAIDPYGNVDTTPAARTFTVDTIAPVPVIDSGPSGIVDSPAARFSFSASEPVTFECKLDDGAFAPCASPLDYSGLTDGLHVFQLRATDTAGNADTTGAARAFTVQTTLPNQLDAVNPNATVTKPRVKRGKKKATIQFSGTDNSTAAGALRFTCSLDGKAAQPCTSPTTYRRLKVGTHSFFVVAQDAAGNLSAPAATNFKVKPKN